MILPIYLPPGDTAPEGAVDLGVSADPAHRRRVVSVVLRSLDAGAIAAAGLLVLRRVGLTEAPYGRAGYRARRDYERYFGDDGQPMPSVVHRLLKAGESPEMCAVCEAHPSVAKPLEGKIYVAACWILWGDPQPGAPWGVASVARELAEECDVADPGADVLAMAREALEGL